MRGSDKFYAEFTLVKGVNCTIGVVRSDFDIRRTKLACSTPDGWGYYARMGSCHHNKPRAQGSWVGQKSSREGDTVGLLLDPSRGTLSVFLNGSKAGDIVRTGLPRGESLCWMVQLCDGAEVRIEKKAVPDTETATEKARRLRDEKRRASSKTCLLYTSPSPRDATLSRMPSSA